MRRSALKKHGQSDIKKAERALDTAFSSLIRTRDAEKPCISCGAVGRAIDAGHFRRRELRATRWNPINVNGQCQKCNRFESKSYEYGLGLDERYGKGTAKKLYQLSRQDKQWQLTELEQLISAAKHSYLAYEQLYNSL